MSLTPTQLEELQTIVETLRTEFSSSDDDLWQAAIRIQKGGLGPVTGSGGQAAFDAAVAEIVLESEQISTVQGRQGGIGQSFDIATFNVVPIEGELPAGSVGDVIYIDTAPSTYLATDVVSLTPAGPNSVILSEVGTQVARTVAAGSGGMEVNNLSTGGGFERVLTVSDMGGAGITIEDEGAPLPGLATTLDFVGAGVTASGAGATKTITIPGYTGADVVAGTIDNQGLRWDVGNNQYEAAPEFAIGDTRDAYIGIPLNTGKLIYVGTISNLVDERAHVGFDGSTLEFEIKNLTASSSVTIKATDAGLNEITFLNANPNGDTLLRGDTGLRLESSSGVIEMEPGGNGFFTFNNAGQLNLLGNGTQSGVLNFTEGTSPFAAVAGEGQLWVRDDTPNVLVFRDDTGVDTVLGAGAPAGTDEQTLVYVGTALQATSFVEHDNQNVIRITDQFAQTHTWTYNAGGGALLELTSTNLADTRFPEGLSIAENSPGTGVFSFNYNGNLITMNASESSTTLRIGNSSTGIDVVEMFQGTRLRFLEVGGLNPIDVRNGGTRLLIDLSDAGVQGMRLDGTASVYLDEQAAAQGDLAGYGQLFVRNDTPNVLIFRDDAGNETDLTAGGGTPGGANTAVQFNDSGSFGGSSDFEWDGSQLKIEASQAQLFLDETDGGGAAQLFLTSTTTADSALVIEFDSSTGVDARIRQATSGGTLQDTWITFREDQGVGLRYNDVQKLATLAEGILSNDSIYIVEKAAANADTATQGQLWVETRPFAQRLMFTPENGADIIVAGLPDSDVSPGSNLISGTSFVAVANIGNVTDTVYMLLINVEVTAPAADDMLIQLTVNTGSRFKGVLTYAGQGITAGSSEIESTTGEVITNNVLVPTSGNSTPDGTYVSIQGVLYADSVAQTVSLRCAKNADTGADGFAIRAVIKALPCSDP